MFDSVSATMEAGEAFAQGISPATISFAGSQPIPCRIGHLAYEERLGEGGLRVIRTCHVSIRRIDLKGAVQFTRGLKVTLKRLVRRTEFGAPIEESIPLEVGDGNASDHVGHYLVLERVPV